MASLIQSFVNLFATSAVQFHPYYLFCSMNAVHQMNSVSVCNTFGGFLNNQCNDYFSKNTDRNNDKSLCYKYITYKDNQNVDMMINKWDKFIDYFTEYNRYYNSFTEVTDRFNIFHDNLYFINDHNANSNSSFTLGINQFTDMTNQEFKDRFVNGLGAVVGSTSCKSFSSSASGAPSSIDWRAKGAVTSVKDQGQCGSCWTFSATGAIEGAWAISTGKLIDFSEEELVECAGLKYGSMGCNGGQMDGAFKYVIENGQCTLSSYPYTSGTGQSGSCKTSCTPVATLSSCSDVVPNDQISLKGAVAKQPVSIAIEADTRYFQSYSSGILDSTSCGTNLDHGVLIVGYGEQNGIKYWNVKNSWSSSWGDNGYVKILRSDSTNDKGICGIAMQPSFPNV
jgi:KDEL-tailed cysteine endopeptidase